MTSHKDIEIFDKILLTNNLLEFKNIDEEFYIEDVIIEDNILKLNVSYSYGCKKHQFLLVEKKNLQKVKNMFSNKDNCE